MLKKAESHVPKGINMHATHTPYNLLARTDGSEAVKFKGAFDVHPPMLLSGLVFTRRSKATIKF